ncbi:chromophore lyase CpcT/CpeT [Prochlorococcus marinus]|uniref:chromophore lyase CpcT/CpeT n=1 Tax=Prochlorococcus marinus TaxID=1219 RepID=UPI0022B33AB1|nr:chromophore lyase CpcT/CpeT [Prochlorococcus marinus]
MSKIISDESSEIVFLNMLCGKFSNKIQSFNSPSLFAHINIYFRQLPSSLLKGLSIYSEQSYDYSPWEPYRQAVHELSIKDNILILKNYKILNQERIAGGGFRSELLKSIKKDKLLLRKSCEMNFIEIKANTYYGYLNKNYKCIIEKDGKETYLLSKVFLDKDKFISLDEGFDLKTNRKIWGSEHGPLEFNRVLETP